MENFLLYIVKSAICLTLFYIFIKVFLSRDTFFKFNRLIILWGTVVCLILPSIELNITEPTPIQAPIRILENIFVENEVLNIETNLPDTAIYNESTEPEQSISFIHILLIIYIIGTLVNFILLCRSIHSMNKLIRDGQKLTYKEYTLVIVQDKINPFSWRKYIIISREDYQKNFKEIWIHEIAHLQHKHSLDLIFLECILLFQWFNPAMWLLKRELKDIHEYQADMSVLQSGIDATKYQLLLVKKAVGTSSYTLANSFNHSKIKKRITMMLKKKSNKWAKAKLLLLLPIGISSVYAFARPEVNKSSSSSVEHKSTNYFSESETQAGSITQEIQQQKEKTTYYLDGIKYSEEEFSKKTKNGLFFLEKEYIPLAKGKVMEVRTQVDGNTMSSPSYVELATDKYTPGMSHVYFVVNGKKYEYEEYKTKQFGRKYINKKDASENGNKIIEVQIITKDGSKNSEKWYYRIPPPPPLSTSPNKDKKTPPPPPPLPKN